MARTFDPFRDMERLFEQRSTSQPGMNMDVYRSADHFVAEIDLPGVDPSSIDIDIDDRTLTIRAERQSKAAEDTQWLTRERATGTFARQLMLGRGIDAGKIEADYTDGVLTVMLPVAEESKPRKVSVAHSGGQREIRSEVVEEGSEG
ncbi:Hsp20/alpha crystallin family protein [Tessaracoccus sp. MC1865]|uniref:Hsp20/alpha crystallin family protein n=1 Tax=unclassified Tessaracoccus TaxID=2635419 RepID=UPI00096D6FC5|nr:Hsp20/alpha crystallin family protein [Tessaracoccus sp. MC1865]MBB1510507.1 Hsp20/alpha crystallin family protein [Tessaracoccus sp. MC1756]MCG6568397.1 Hsp20/alpha crystallin family protein [Tessaracoccus sp. ZS01]OMG52802.1 heat-shock protein Hsp20 [Tessaracoccus sp. ZS01]QTO37661.1 Hsp20/alpha crystallin family protein [Tessaracoccus sp. MC1865]